MGGVRDVPWSIVSQGMEGWVQKEEGKGKNQMAQQKPGKSAQGNLKTDWGVTDTRNPCTACKGRRITEFKASPGKTLPFPKREDWTKGKQGWQKTTCRPGVAHTDAVNCH